LKFYASPHPPLALFGNYSAYFCRFARFNPIFHIIHDNFTSVKPEGNRMKLYKTTKKYNLNRLFRQFFRNFCLLCTLAGSPSLAPAANSVNLIVDSHLIQINSWGINDGLTHWLIEDIAEDSKKYVWLLRYDKLIRFDGKRFKIYDFINTENSYFSELHSLSLDKRNNLILAGVGLNRKVKMAVFDPQTGVFLDSKQYFGDASNGNSPIGSIHTSFRTFSICGNFYFMSNRGVLWHFDEQWEKLIDLSDENYLFRLLLPAGDNQFWAFPKDGDAVKLVTNAGQTRKEFTLDEINSPEFWLGPDVSLWVWNPLSSEYIQLKPEAVRLVHSPDSLPDFSWGNFIKLNNFPRPNPNGYTLTWEQDKLTLRHKGKLLYENLNQYIFSTLNVTPHRLDRLFMLSDNSFILKGTNGFVRIQIQASPFNFELNEASAAISLRGIGEWNDSTLLVNSYQGSFLIDKKHLYPPIKIQLPFPGNSSVGFAVATPANQVWIGSSDSYILKYNKSAQHFTSFPYAPNPAFGTYDFFFPPSSPTPIIASLKGLFAFNESLNAFSAFRLQDTTAYCIKQHGSNLWIGTSIGLYNWRTQRFFLTRGKSIKVFHILPESEDLLWLATSEGLILWSSFLKRAYQFNLSPNYPIPSIHCVYKDQQERIWMTSNQGLLVLSLKDGTLKVFNETDGLFVSEFNSLSHHQASDGHLYFGTINGLVSFHPDKFRDDLTRDFNNFANVDQIALQVRKKWSVEDINHTNPPLDIFRIPKATQFLTIDFSVPYFDSPTLALQWRIPGIVDAWQALNIPQINIPAPKYGTYPIEIKMFDQRTPAKYQEQELITLLVPAPIYAKAGFWIALFTLAITLFLAAIKVRLRYLLAQKSALQKLVRAQVSEIEAQLKKIQFQKSVLEEIDLQRMRFFSNLIHELRTPITIISGHIQSLKKIQIQYIASNEHVRQLEGSLNDIQQITDEISDLIRLDKGLMELSKDSAEWPSFLRNTVDDWRLIAAEKDQKIFLISGSAPQYIEIDMLKLRRMINNLLNNAVKYIQRNGEIYVTEMIQHNQLTIKVKDNGPGISEEKHELVFQRFFQATRDSVTSHAGGLGIGLAICKEYAETMGGFISLESQPEQGSEFTLVLPIRLTDTPPAKEVTESLPPLTSMIENTPSETNSVILVVEDKSKMQEYIGHLLGNKARVITANNGKEALDILLRGEVSIDLVISDVRMPEMDGFQLLQEVRQDQHTHINTIPFLFLTALHESEYALKAFRMGVDGYLSKPFNQDELLARADNLIARFTNRKTINASTAPPEEISTEEITNTYQSGWIDQFQLILHKHLKNPSLKVSDLASELYVSERTLRNKITLYTGLTPGRLILLERLNMAYRLLQAKKYATVSEVCYEVGIRNVSHFTKAFKKEFGRLPSDLLK
jgi:signal transduction histidine kinase/DNA-binding response OmpR family regulator